MGLQFIYNGHGGRSKVRGVEFQQNIVGQMKAKTHHRSGQCSCFSLWQLGICHRTLLHGGTGFVGSVLHRGGPLQRMSGSTTIFN